jgi:hypothetical protein
MHKIIELHVFIIKLPSPDVATMPASDPARSAQARKVLL